MPTISHNHANFTTSDFMYWLCQCFCRWFCSCECNKTKRMCGFLVDSNILNIAECGEIAEKMFTSDLKRTNQWCFTLQPEKKQQQKCSNLFPQWFEIQTCNCETVFSVLDFGFVNCNVFLWNLLSSLTISVIWKHHAILWEPAAMTKYSLLKIKQSKVIIPYNWHTVIFQSGFLYPLLRHMTKFECKQNYLHKKTFWICFRMKYALDPCKDFDKVKFR